MSKFRGCSLPSVQHMQSCLLLLLFLVVCMIYSLLQEIRWESEMVLRETSHPSDQMAGIALHPELHNIPGQVYKIWETPMTKLDYHMTLEPKSPCRTNPSLVIFVHSRPHFSKSRQAIRDTWGKMAAVKNASLAVYFVTAAGTGEFNSTIQRKLEAESEKHEDIIQFNFIDSYYNLTLKSLMELKWVVHSCPSIEFVMKVDDDVFVDVISVVKFLDDFAPRNNVMIGDIRHRAEVFRHHPKWGIPYHRFPEEAYPDYLKGAAYIMSADLPLRLYDTASYVMPIHIDDVYITGILAQILNVTLIRSNHLRGWEFMSPNPCFLHSVGKMVLMGPSNPKQLKLDEKPEYHRFMYDVWQWLKDEDLKDHCYWQTPVWTILNWIL